MSSREIHEWTCDRCGKTATSDELPPGWRRVWDPFDDTEQVEMCSLPCAEAWATVQLRDGWRSK